MNWLKPLYVGEQAADKKREIIHKLNAHRPMMGVFVVTLAQNGIDLLEVMQSNVLEQRVFTKNQDVLILGIAVSKQEALELMTKIVMDVYEKTGTYDVQGYFKGQKEGSRR